MDSGIQIQSLKSQIENMELQINNIQMQFNNMNMMNNLLGEQLINLSIQLFNSGIQAFNTGKIMVINNINSFEQLIQISEKINLILNENNIQQQMLIQQQMMMEHQQIMMQQKFMSLQKLEEKEKYMNIAFRNMSNNKFSNLIVPFGTTVGDLLNKYLEKFKLINTDKLAFLFNARKLDRNDTRKVENFFAQAGVLMPNPLISVFT